MGVWLFCNRALVWCLSSIDYEMLELGSDDLVRGFGLCPWSPSVALLVLLNLGVEVALMYLDSLRLPNYAQNPHINSRRLVARGTQIPYSATVDLVAGFGVSQRRSNM
ncbi:hypothetical protein M9H77_23860 [Catharanthus roseus]|uniref:Uncharacterized protein n=1 Tax=Catharanthus roseus TaxID=4058 RepID=A0ACC0AVQ7_CATRO|nr:hypothetical protein M9H77_23860 [Catharanthus roseus]